MWWSLQGTLRRITRSEEGKRVYDSRIELTIPGCNLSPRCLKRYMTEAQLSVAIIVKGTLAGGIGRGFEGADVRGGKGCARG